MSNSTLPFCPSSKVCTVNNFVSSIACLDRHPTSNRCTSSRDVQQATTQSRDRESELQSPASITFTSLTHFIGLPVTRYQQYAAAVHNNHCVCQFEPLESCTAVCRLAANVCRFAAKPTASTCSAIHSLPCSATAKLSEVWTVKHCGQKTSAPGFLLMWSDLVAGL